jgi:integrase
MYKGERIRGSTGETDRYAAEAVMIAHFQALKDRLDGVQRYEEVNFEQAAAYYVETFNGAESTFKENARALRIWVGRIGGLKLSQVHDLSVKPFVDIDRVAGLSSGTVTRALSVVQKVLNDAHRKWRHPSGEPWLKHAVSLSKPNWRDKEETPVITYAEQKRVMRELPTHLCFAALFSVNTGLRANECKLLRWSWIQEHDQLGYYIVLPGSVTKNKEARAVPLNSIARSVLNSVRHDHPEIVFTYKQKPIQGQFSTKAWRAALKRAGVKAKWHSWRHTFASRLEHAGVTIETRNLILGHEKRRIGEVYAHGTLETLFAAVEAVTEQTQTTTLSRQLLRAVR